MRTKHTPHSLPAFPIYSCAFVAPNEVILGGGGGQSRSGIKNKLRLYNVESDKKLELLDEYELAVGEDSPMSMAADTESKQIVCGINSIRERLDAGENENCRVFGIKESKISFVHSHGTLSLKSTEDDFQKVTVLSPDSKYIAVAGHSDLSLLHFPSLDPAATSIKVSQGEIYDASFSSTALVIVTTVNLLVYALPDTSTNGKQKVSELELVKTVDRPPLPGKDAGSSFRAARFHPNDSKVLYTVINTVPPKTRGKTSPRRAFLCRWNTDTWQVTKVRQVSDRGLTCFDVSPNGKLLAYGSSDYSVGIVDAQSLAPLLTILKAHDFPPTTLRFNPTSSLLISGSADNSARVVSIPETLGDSPSWSSWIIVIVTILIILFAIIAQQMHGPSLIVPE